MAVITGEHVGLNLPLEVLFAVLLKSRLFGGRDQMAGGAVIVVLLPLIVDKHFFISLF
jgi:hypothetical protein